MSCDSDFDESAMRDVPMSTQMDLGHSYSDSPESILVDPPSIERPTEFDSEASQMSSDDSIIINEILATENHIIMTRDPAAIFKKPETSTNLTQVLPVENPNPLSPEQKHLLETVVCNVKDRFKTLFNVEKLVETNLNVIGDSEKMLELTPLHQVKHPSANSKCSLFNVMGVVRGVSPLCESTITIELYDENCEQFFVKLLYKNVNEFKANRHKIKLDKQLNKCDKNAPIYPGITIGSIVSIEDLVLTNQLNKFCLNPSQLKVVNVDVHSYELAVSKKRLLSLLEMVRLVELFCHHSMTMSLYKPFSSLSGATLINIHCQLLSRNVSNRPDYAEYFVLVPGDGFPPVNWRENAAPVIVSYVETMSFLKNRLNYDDKLLRALINRNHILRIIVFGRHMAAFKNYFVLELVSLLRVHVKPDKMNKGSFAYIIHEDDLQPKVNKLPLFSTSFFYQKIKNLVEVVKIEENINQAMVEDELEAFLNNQNQENKPAIRNENAESSIHHADDNNDLPLSGKVLDGNTDWGEISRISVRNGDRASSSSSQKHSRQTESSSTAAFYKQSKQFELFPSGENLSEAKRIVSFGQLDGCSPGESFVISACLVDYYSDAVADKKMTTIASLRQRYLHVTCENVQCPGSIESILLLLPKLAHLYAQESLRQENALIQCPHCQSKLLFTLQVPLTLIDKQRNRFTVAIASPTLSCLLPYSNDDLLFSDPSGSRIVLALEYVLKTLCPTIYTQTSVIVDDLPEHLYFDWLIRSLGVNKDSVSSTYSFSTSLSTNIVNTFTIKAIVGHN